MLAGLVVVLGLILWGWVFTLFDEVVKYHHDHYHDDWMSEGKPRGMFFVPREAERIYSGLPFFFYASKLKKGLFRWVENGTKANYLVKRYIFWEKVWLVYIVVAIPTVIYFS